MMLDMPLPEPGDPEVLTFLHVAGHRAVGDRNGTELFVKALRFLRHPCKVRLVGQDGALPLPELLPRHVELEANHGGVVDRWDLYRGADVLVSPRRFGGLSLPVIEAIGMGLVVLMTDCEPNREWPIIPIPASVGKGRQTPFGLIRTHDCRPRNIAAEMDRLSEDRQQIVSAQARRSRVDEEKLLGCATPAV